MDGKLIFFVFLFFILPLASAQIVFENNFNNVYNVGDVVHVNISIQKPESISDYLETYLSCGNSNFLVGKNYVSVLGGEIKKVYLDFPISIYGLCHLKSSFDGDSQLSQQFNVSSSIKINYDLNALSFSPKDNFSIAGTATKANGDLLNGTLKIFSPGIIEKTIVVSKGKFIYNFKIPSEALPGKHNFTLEASEEDPSNNLINFGKKSFNITIYSVPSKIVSKINFTEVHPPKNITVNFSLEDQVGNSILNKSLILKVTDPENNIIVKKTINSPGKYIYKFPENATRGLWSFGFYYGSFSSFSKIYVEENKKLFFNVLNNTLVIKNIGNVLYEGIITYSFQNASIEENKSINVNLDVGKQMRIPLNLNGSYNVSAGGQSLGRFSFTGNAIKGSPLGVVYPNHKIFFGIIFLIIIIFLFLKKKKLNLKDLASKNNKYKTKRTIFSRVKSNVNVYAIFFKNLNENLNEFKEVFEDYGWSLHKINNEISFILFYSKQKSSSKKVMKLAKEIINIAKIKRIPLSLSINSEKFYKDKTLISKFALKSRKMLEKASTGEIIVSKKILKDLEITKIQRKVLINLNGEEFKAYVI